MRITIVGGASAYVPGLIRGVLARLDVLDGSEVLLYDIDAGRLEILDRLATKMAAAAGSSLRIRSTTDIDDATTDTDFALTTFRPGGLEGRAVDERIPLGHGVIGQETAGPGGFFLACRAVPVVLDLAARLERRSPAARLINYTNPTNVVTDAVRRHSPVPIVGLCDQHVADTSWWADRLGYPLASFEPRWFGLNHATWAAAVHIGGRDASAAVFDRVDALDPPAHDPASARLIRLAQTLRVLPNSYARYYFFHDEIAAELRAEPRTRGEVLAARSPAWYEDYRRAATETVPDPSTERGGAAHGEFAIDMICALAADERRPLTVNVRNGGAISDLDADSTVEVPAVVGAAGIDPLVCGDLPASVRGLTRAIANYERLAADAAVTGKRDTALVALATHPFVRSLDVARAILDEGLAAHADALPQFAGT